MVLDRWIVKPAGSDQRVCEVDPTTISCEGPASEVNGRRRPPTFSPWHCPADRSLKKRRPSKIILDLDSTDDHTHGQQEFSFYHGYYRNHILHPLLIFDADTGDLVCREPATLPIFFFSDKQWGHHGKRSSKCLGPLAAQWCASVADKFDDRELGPRRSRGFADRDSAPNLYGYAVIQESCRTRQRSDATGRSRAKRAALGGRLPARGGLSPDAQIRLSHLPASELGHFSSRFSTA